MTAEDEEWVNGVVREAISFVQRGALQVTTWSASEQPIPEVEALVPIGQEDISRLIVPIYTNSLALAIPLVVYLIPPILLFPRHLKLKFEA